MEKIQGFQGEGDGNIPEKGIQTKGLNSLPSIIRGGGILINTPGILLNITKECGDGVDGSTTGGGES